MKCADLARAEDVGDEVTYVVNRNINFTNICFVGCQFCGFKRQRWESDAYDHSDDDDAGKVEDAIARGATEVCMQGGINPEMPTVQVSRPARRDQDARFPRFTSTPSRRWRSCTAPSACRMDYPEYIAMLRDAGLGSIPGTAAEILDDDVREILSHKKVDVAAWVEIVTTAHAARRAYDVDGDVRARRKSAARRESSRPAAHDPEAIRTASPSSCRCASSIRTRCSIAKAWCPPIDRGQLDFQMYATSRLFLRGQIDNLQTSWVKLRHRSRGADAQGRMQRSVGHPDGGKHHGAGGRRLGRVHPGRRDRGEGARDGPRRGRAHHALQKALRKKGTQWRAANRDPSRPGRSPR